MNTHDLTDAALFTAHSAIAAFADCGTIGNQPAPVRQYLAGGRHVIQKFVASPFFVSFTGDI